VQTRFVEINADLLPGDSQRLLVNTAKHTSGTNSYYPRRQLGCCSAEAICRRRNLGTRVGLARCSANGTPRVELLLVTRVKFVSPLAWRRRIRHAISADDDVRRACARATPSGLRPLEGTMGTLCPGETAGWRSKPTHRGYRL